MSSAEFSISKVLGRALELAQKRWGAILVFNIVTGVISYVINSILSLPFSITQIMPYSSASDATDNSSFWLSYMAVYIFVSFIVGSIQSIGVNNMYLRALRGMEPALSAFKLPVRTYFHYILVCLVMYLIWIGFILYLVYCVVVLYYGTYYVGGSDDSGIMIMALVALLLFIGSCTLRVMFAPLLVIDTRSCNAWRALNISLQMTKGHFWRLFALGIVLILVNCVGYICCCIGILFTSIVSGFAFVVSYEILKPRQDHEPLAPTPSRSPSSPEVPPATAEATPKRQEQTPEEWVEEVLAAKEKTVPAATPEPAAECASSVTTVKEEPKVEESHWRRAADDLYDVVLLDAGGRRDEVERSILGAVYDRNADEVRTLVEALPSVLMKVPRLQAERMKTILEEVGAKVEIR